jgi:hypothetical protein
MKRRNTIATVALIAGCGAMLLGGCTSRGPWGYGSPAPGLINMHETPGEASSKFVTNTDIGRRLILEDITRMWHAGRPTRLTPLPIPY